MARPSARNSCAWTSRLHERVIGQDEAVTAVADADPPRTQRGCRIRTDRWAVYLPGPDRRGQDRAGAGVAEFLFDDEQAMTRIDMSEYMEKHSVSRLIGAPPGYVGHEEGGQLSESVRRRPYSVVLFDEIEKAHPDVFNVLQVLDDGRLTDGQGRTVDFRNTVIIMTSNIGSSLIQEHFSASKAIDEALHAGVMDELKRCFRPEFLNRVDDSIIFGSLDETQLGAIVDIQLNRVDKRQLINSGPCRLTTVRELSLPRRGTTLNLVLGHSNELFSNTYSTLWRSSCWMGTLNRGHHHRRS